MPHLVFSLHSNSIQVRRLKWNLKLVVDSSLESTQCILLNGLWKCFTCCKEAAFVSFYFCAVEISDEMEQSHRFSNISCLVHNKFKKRWTNKTTNLLKRSLTAKPPILLNHSSSSLLQILGTLKEQHNPGLVHITRMSAVFWYNIVPWLRDVWLGLIYRAWNADYRYWQGLTWPSVSCHIYITG